MALVLCACESQATPAPSAALPAPTGVPTAAPATPAPTPTPAAYADTLRVGWAPQVDPEAFRGLALTIYSPPLSFNSAVYSGVYRFDARFGAIPDLADGPCAPQPDPNVIRCRIVETTFHDGTPLTADDVAYTFRLFSAGGFASSWTGRLTEARVVDPRTVDFVLSGVDPTFLSEKLPAVPILPRHAVEAAYADFVARTEDLTAEGLRQLGETIDEETGRDPPVCTTHLDEVETLLAKLGAHLYREDYQQASGTFDPCRWMQVASAWIQHVAWALGASGTEAVMGALVFFGLFSPLPGAGPYRLVSAAADRVHLEAWPGYHGGRAATGSLDFVPAKGDGSDLAAGSVDVSVFANLGAAFKATAASRGIQVVTNPTTRYFALVFNSRPGRLFADLALRRALQLCIDLERDVDAATAGGGTAVYGPVLPGSWGDDPDLPRPTRDVPAAKRLIEGAGWRLGAGGIYVKAGVRLEAVIPVRADHDPRVKIVDLIAAQARDCGMDLATLPKSFDDLLAMIGSYPHNIPGTPRPFDLYLAGWVNGPDPADGLGAYVSSQITDPEHPDGNTWGNYIGFSDPAFDRLFDAANAIYDQAERARLFRQAQEELASQVPAVFLWSYDSYDLVRQAVATVDGPLDLTVPNWAWAPERLMVVASP